MAEDAQRRVESALSNFVDEIEKSNLRKMQRSSWESNISNSLPKQKGSSTSTESPEKLIALVDLSSSIDIDHVIEEDDVIRRANFYVYATKLQSLASSGGSMGLASGFLDLKTLMHWSVVVEFEAPRSVYTLDADTAGGLTGSKFVVKVKRQYPEQVQRKIELGSVKISPKELIRRAKKLYLNQGEYDFIFANCQSWTHKFCCEISPDFATKVPVTIGDCTSIAATIGMTVFSMAAAGIGIGWAFCKLIQHRQSTLPSRTIEDEKDEE